MQPTKAYFVNTVSQNIGGMTAVNAAAILSKLKNDHGNDFTPLRDAAANYAASVFNPVLADVRKYLSDSNKTKLCRASSTQCTKLPKVLTQMTGAFAATPLLKRSFARTGDTDNGNTYAAHYCQ
ncbi:hypothetical protein QR680_015754 [Steinernema hermaphroditum]|uniref:Uncharacterized protein n=1 Tax=Steinernema hermaphroditum TaxID=289476 RepID=A0AA39H938_9BILA|nr:hypothetical protein QR680_015754 [Steinernema hermaphroditum]